MGTAGTVRGMHPTALRPTALRLVRTFHETFGHPVALSPHVPSARLRQLRIDLIVEEAAELEAAAAKNDRVGVADGLADLIVVIAGAALVWGVEPVSASSTSPSVSGEIPGFITATKAQDPEAIAVALGLLWDAVETAALVWNIPLAACVDEVHASNMSKLGADGQPITRPDGKILKGPNYFRPNLVPILATSR